MQTKPFIAFLNRNSGIKRGQPHNTYNIIITDTKAEATPLLFLFLGGTNRTIAEFFEKFFTLSKPFQTRASYTYNEATTIAQTTTFMFNQ